VLGVSAFFTAFTYISPFLTRVSGLAHGDVALVLLVNGLATTTGVLACGALYGRRPRTATIVPVALLATALLGLYAAGSSAFGAIAFQSLDGLAIGGIAVTMQTGVLVVAPRSADIASSWFSASFNVGIASGPLIGALVLADVGLRSTPLVAGLLALGALTVLVGGTRWSGATRPVS
jgi:predicted MFS family arabinose efflux permease